MVNWHQMRTTQRKLRRLRRQLLQGAKAKKAAANPQTINRQVGPGLATESLGAAVIYTRTDVALPS